MSLLVSEPLQPPKRASPAGAYGRSLALALGYYAVLATLAWTILPHQLFTHATFSQWDAEHYLFIKDHGYNFENTAFFPLFPWLWRALGLAPVGMGLANLALFAGAFAALSTAFAWSWRQQLLALSVPSLCFMVLPYSEALFFVGGVLVLIGYRQHLLALVALGLLLSCLTRSAAFVLAPAAVLTELLTRQSWPSFGRRAGLAVAACAAGLLGSVYAHYLDTGRWFVFFEAQKIWNNQLQLPHWPFSNWGDFANRYDSVAFFGAVAGGAYLIRLLRRQRAAALPAAWAPVLFSLAYTAGVTAVTVATKGGVLVSLGRYVLATPYCLVLVVWLLENHRFGQRQLLWAFGAAFACWAVFFNAFGHIRDVLFDLGIGAYLLVILSNAHSNARVRKLAFAVVIVVNSGLLLELLRRFLLNEWIG